MTPSEFKAWFDGFTEAFTGVPTKAQWARVKERVAEIDGKPIAHTIYVDRYLPSIPNYPYVSPYWYPKHNTAAGMGQTTTFTSNNVSNQIGSGGMAQNYNSHDAMAALGRADAQSLAKA